ncbi:MAG: hypothetical protein RLZZ292_3543 [Bacteroidota bacterium]|jgi:hypothetical protein
MEEEIVLKIDYDGNWKVITGELILDFIQFTIPLLYEDLDLSVEPEFLEQEFFEIVEELQSKNITDKLVKFKLKNGQDKWIFIHIEFQTEGNISERMFTYYRRILDKYGKEITAVVVYTGKSVPKNFSTYESSNYGTDVLYRFNTYLVAKQKEADLLKDMNPFSIVVLANLYVNKTKKDLKKRLSFKEKLYEIAFKRGYSIEKTSKLFIFLKELMRLTPALEEEFKNYILSQKKVEEKNMMPVSQDTRDFLHEFYRRVYGKTIEEVTKEKDAALQSKDAALQSKDAALQSKDAIIIRSIVQFRDTMNLSAPQIASILGIELDYVEQVLSNLEH